MKRFFVLLVGIATVSCRSNQTPVEAPIIVGSAAPTPSAAPTTTPAAPAPDKPRHPTSPAVLADRLEAALNAGDLETAHGLSTDRCWEHECSSLALQATRKFKVKRIGDIASGGIRATVTFDVLCDGTRLCDRVWILASQDCFPAPGYWVEDVTENKKKVAAWTAEAPAACQ